MRRLRRSGTGSGVNAPSDEAESPPVPASVEQGAAQAEEPGGLAIRRRRRLRRIAIAAPFLIVLSWAIVSYSAWMLEPTSMQWSERSAEWVRNEVPFGNWMVDQGEQVAYNLNPPKTGGPQLKALPTVGVNPTRTTSPPKAQTAAWPPPVKPVFPHPLPGEGVWKPTGQPVDGGPPVLVTTFRPELDYPQLVAYVAWFDHTRTEIGYYPGRYEPPNAAVRGPMMVPDDQRWRLLATFNGGFTYTDGANGSADNGRTNEPLKDGNATLIGYRDGRIAILNWSGGPDVGSDVAWARQSLAPSSGTGS